MSRPVFLSIVSPVYRAQFLLDELVTRIRQAVAGITEDFEIILVEDGSPDDSWAVIERQCASDERVRGLRLARNFGQHRAITAGLAHARGEWTVVMDCDLQDRPEEIPALLRWAQQGHFDSVAAQRTVRQDAAYKRLLSRLFYRSVAYLTGLRHDPSIANFGVYHRRVVEAVLAMADHIRFFPLMVRWVGFRAGTLPVEHAGRPQGRSSYRLSQLARLGMDIILTFSDKPLSLLLRLGLLLSAAAVLPGPVAGYLAVTRAGWSVAEVSLLTSVWFLAGLVLAALGGVGLYVGKTFEQTKHRPLYLVAEYAGGPGPLVPIHPSQQP